VVWQKGRHEPGYHSNKYHLGRRVKIQHDFLWSGNVYRLAIEGSLDVSQIRITRGELNNRIHNAGDESESRLIGVVTEAPRN